MLVRRKYLNDSDKRQYIGKATLTVSGIPVVFVSKCAISFCVCYSV